MKFLPDIIRVSATGYLLYQAHGHAHWSVFVLLLFSVLSHEMTALVLKFKAWRK